MKAQVFPPGEFIFDELEARGWTTVQFAVQTGIDQNTLTELIAGRARLTSDHARKIARAFDTSPTFWVNLEQAYRSWLSKVTG